MNAIIGFFTGLADLLGGAFEFLLSLVSDIVYTASLIVKAVASLPGFFTWLPPPVLALVITIFGVVAIYKLIGREG